MPPFTGENQPSAVIEEMKVTISKTIENAKKIETRITKLELSMVAIAESLERTTNILERYAATMATLSAAGVV